MQILYLEDDLNTVELVSRYITTTPHELSVATNVDDARDAMVGNPDMILIDILLGEARHGIDFARELREQGFNNALIAVTAFSTRNDQQACYDAGFDQILGKPFTLSQLGSVLDNHS